MKDLITSNMKYFTSSEFRETIGSSIYDARTRRERRAKYTYQSGATYTGEWRGGFRDGHGEQTWQDGAKYIGDWEMGKAHGKGRFIHLDGDVYDGEWRNDRANGYGVY